MPILNLTYFCPSWGVCITSSSPDINQRLMVCGVLYTALDCPRLRPSHSRRHDSGNRLSHSANHQHHHNHHHEWFDVCYEVTLVFSIYLQSWILWPFYCSLRATLRFTSYDEGRLLYSLVPKILWKSYATEIMATMKAATMAKIKVLLSFGMAHEIESKPYNVRLHDRTGMGFLRTRLILIGLRLRSHRML